MFTEAPLRINTTGIILKTLSALGLGKTALQMA